MRFHLAAAFTASVLSAAVLAPAAFAQTPTARVASVPGPGVKVKIKTADGTDAGTAVFTPGPDGVHITLDLKNLTPGDHGVHIHEKPLCEAPNFTTAGGHFNPDNKSHGYQNPNGHHNGDLPSNVTVAPDGTAKTEIVDPNISMKKVGEKNNILDNGGTSIIIHAKADDMMTDPSGNSGGRIACGVIVADTKIPVGGPHN